MTESRRFNMKMVWSVLPHFMGLCASLASPAEPSPEEMREMYSAFQSKYGHSSDSLDRFQTFENNVKTAIDLNAKQGSICKDLLNGGEACVFGITPLSDVSKEEFRGLTGFVPDDEANQALSEQAQDFMKNSTSATSVDWSRKGATTPVKMQGFHCGSCWAHGAAETIESGLFMATGELVTLSVQDMISCAHSGSCHGGSPNGGLNWAKKHGIALESTYPETSNSTGDTGSCIAAQDKPVAKVTDWFPVVHHHDWSLQKEQFLATFLLSHGPVGIAVNAGPLQHYRGGVLRAVACGNHVNHATQLVGFNLIGAGDYDLTPYWIMRNSWDTWWGEKGFARLEYGSNTCGLVEYTYWARVSKISPRTTWAQRDLVDDQGKELAELDDLTADLCSRECEQVNACHSFSFSSAKKRCHLKDRCVSASDRGRRNGDYVTYYKPCSSAKIVV